MKLNTNRIIVKACLALIILASCESKEQKSNDAFDLFKEEKMALNDSTIISKETDKTAHKIESVKINEHSEEWIKFKSETEKKILANKNMIKKIKQTPEANVKLFKKTIRLEKDNDDLKIQLKVYEEEVKANLEKFKEKINFEAKEIETKLKDISIYEKK